MEAYRIQQDAAQELWACSAIRGVMGGTVHPGGLELTERGVRLLQLAVGSRILDVGCGTGASVACLRDRLGLDAVGIDPSAQMRAGGPGLPLYPGRAERIPFETGSMDAAMMECCFHLTTPEQALQELWRVLRPGGKLLLSDLYPRTDVTGGGLYTQTELVQLLEQHGFRLCIWEDHIQQLRQLMVDIIMEYGSMDRFWDSMACSCGSRCGILALRDRRLSYYLLVAQRVGPEDGAR